MGGFSSSASTGGGGGSGPAGRKSDGSYGTKRDAKKASRRNELSTAIKNFEPLPVKIIKSFVKGQKKSKQNVLDYEGQAAGVTPMRAPFTPSDNGNDNNNQPTIKSVEQPKVKSQMSNTDVKSDMITAKAPAAAEMTADEIILKNKKKGRKKTILTSVSGVDAYPTLSKKTLLGG